MRGKGRFLLLFLVVMLTTLAGAGAEAPTERAVAVQVGEVPLAGAIVREGTTYVPLRPLMALLGDWSVSWEGDAAAAASELMTLRVPIGEPRLELDGYAEYDCRPAFLRGGRTYVPLRTVAELCGAEVNWRGWDEPVEVIPAKMEEPREDDLYWLSRIISAESRGESLAGQLAVGAVVLNRVAAPNYPNTIYSVIFEYNYDYQFEPVENGTVYQEPTAQSVLAARLCLNGTRELKDCRYFFNPALSPGTWIRENREYVTTIGCHQFYR